MKRKLNLFAVFIALLTGCETIYHPDLEKTDPLLVVSAQFVYGQSDHFVRLTRSLNFTDDQLEYPPVSDAVVYLIDDKKNTIQFVNSGSGIYSFSHPLAPDRKYKIAIHEGGNVYESTFQGIPELPEIDTVYAEPAEKMVEESTDQAAGHLLKIPGAMLFADLNTGNGNSRYRFSGTKICQLTYQFISKPFGLPETMFLWISVAPGGLFNIAAPSEYSSSPSIIHHPLAFFEAEYPVMIGDTATNFSGWVYLCYQYAISDETYRFYSDMNTQLSASGKLFDPLYLQVRGNISCRNDSFKTALGNFEITAMKEHRFYLEQFGNDRFCLKKIPGMVPIPRAGKNPEIPPVWWESCGREYPEEN